MAKIITLKEEMLIGGTSEEQLYPKTHTKAVHTADGEILQDILDDIEEGSYLADGSVKTRHLAEKSITTEKVADSAIDTSKIQDYSITAQKLGTDSIETNKIKDAAVTGNKIALYTISSDNMKEDSILTSAIKDGAVTSDKLYNNAVKNKHLDNSSVDSRVIADESIDTSHIKNGIVTYEKLAENSVGNTHLVDASVNSRVLDDNAVTSEKIADASITYAKIQEHTVNEGNMAADAISTRTIVDENVTNRKLATDAVSEEKILNESVTTPKIKDSAVTNDKLADKTITIDKLDEKLKGAIEAATGMPEDLMKQFLEMSENISNLQDTVYPITLSLAVDYLALAYSVSFSVKYQNQPFIADTLTLKKQLASGQEKILSNIPAASGIASTPMESNREIFTLSVSAKGHTTKSTSIVKYICYAGGNTATTITEGVINSLTLLSTTGVGFNPSVKTSDGQYIWLVVPQYLTINKVTSSGFDVPLSEVQTITTTLGTFKAYRTVNPLTNATWNLVIS